MAEKTLEQMREAVEEIRAKMAAAAREAGRDPAEAHRRRARKIYRGGLMPYGRKNTGRDAGGRAGHP